MGDPPIPAHPHLVSSFSVPSRTEETRPGAELLLEETASACPRRGTSGSASLLSAAKLREGSKICRRHAAESEYSADGVAAGRYVFREMHHAWPHQVA
jgi:hypothetical protein